MQIDAQSIQEAAQHLTTFRQYKPFQYGGKWFIAKLGKEMHAFRSLAPIKSRLAKLGIQSTEVAILE